MTSTTLRLRSAQPTRRLGRFAAVLVAMVLTGCAGALPVPPDAAHLSLPRKAHLIEQIPGQLDQDVLLVVQAEDGDGATRWSMFDPLGMPLARQVLRDGTWRNDGFLRPNARASNLFSTILFAWTPTVRLEAAYPRPGWRERADADGGRVRTLSDYGCTPRWTVQWQPGASQDRFTIHSPDGTAWRVESLEERP